MKTLSANRIARSRNLWILFILLIGIVSLSGELVNHRFEMIDLEVYHITAQRILGHEPIYDRPAHQNDHYVFKYSPTAGMYFIPLSWVPFQFARYLHWIVLMLIPALAIGLFYRLLNPTAPEFSGTKNGVIILSLLVILTHYHREIRLGQVNMLLMSLYMVLIYLFVHLRRVEFSLLLSITVFLKPFALIFLPYLLLKREFKIIAYIVAFSVVLGFSPLLFYPSWPQLGMLYSDWIQEMFVELGSKQDLFANANHTIFSVLARFTPIRWLHMNETGEKIYQVVLLALMGFGILVFMRYNRKHLASVNEMLLLIALIPLLAFTSENAFVFTLPLVMYLIFHFHQLDSIQKFLLISGGLLVGGNIYDVVGPSLNFFLSDISVYTFGTMMLIGCLVWFQLGSKNLKSLAA